MVDIEPYQYQKTTNLKEHNDIVAKINEIVDVINNTNLDTIIPRISKLETDVSGLTDNDSIQNNDISSLKTKTAKLETDVSELTDTDSVQNNDISSLKTKTAKLETDVSVINDTDSLQWQDIESVKGDIGTITPKITKLEQDVTDINSTDAIQNTNISNLKTKDSEHDTRLGTIDTEITDITKSLVSDVAILTGTTSGNVKVRIGRNDAPSIDSDDYNIQKPTSVELVQGSAPAMVKAQITLSDGTVLISDDFMFTTEAIGQDVYISSFVFKNGNVAGSISADIGLSNGSTLTANNFVVPTDPNVTTAISDIQGRVTTVENDVSGLKTTVNGHTTSINGLDSEVSDLQTRMTAVEGDVSGFDALKTTVDGHTASISALDSDVANLQVDKADADNSNQTIVAGSISATNISKGGVPVATINDIPVVPDISGKADLNNPSQNIIAGTINATNINKNGVAVATTNDIPDISGKVDKAQGTANVGKVLGINASGNVEPVTIESGGEVWEEIDLNNFPTDWVAGDRVKIRSNTQFGGTTPSSWTSPITDVGEMTDHPTSPIAEFILNNSNINEGSVVIYVHNSEGSITLTYLGIGSPVGFNSPASPFVNLTAVRFNGTGRKQKYIGVTRLNLTTYVKQMWRLKK